MKNLKQLFGGILLAFGLASFSHAAVVVSPKEVFVSSYTTGAVIVTPAISSNAVASAAYMPGAVYELIQSSGAASEYFQMYDSTTSANITCGTPGSVVAGTSELGPKFLYGSTTANTVTRLDPPIVFHNGLVVCDSAVTGKTAVTYELGRGLSGQ